MTKRTKANSRGKAGLTVEQWPLDRVKPYPRNPRKVTDAAVAKVAASITEFGWRQPIVVDAKGVILADHTRLLADLPDLGAIIALPQIAALNGTRATGVGP